MERLMEEALIPYVTDTEGKPIQNLFAAGEAAAAQLFEEYYFGSLSLLPAELPLRELWRKSTQNKQHIRIWTAAV